MKWMTMKEVSEQKRIVDTTGKPANYMFIRKLVKLNKLKAKDFSAGDKNPRYLIQKDWVQQYLDKHQ